MPAQARVTHGWRIDKVTSGEGQPDIDSVGRLTIHHSRNLVQAVCSRDGLEVDNEETGREEMRWVPQRWELSSSLYSDERKLVRVVVYKSGSEREHSVQPVLSQVSTCNTVRTVQHGRRSTSYSGPRLSYR